MLPKRYGLDCSLIFAALLGVALSEISLVTNLVLLHWFYTDQLLRFC